MNDKERMIERNKIARMLTRRSKPFRNKIIIRVGNSFEHEQCKLVFAYRASMNGEE